jgi:hypothetical protein
MGVKHHRKIYINCATAYINKNHRIPIRAADRTRSEQDSTYLPLSLLRTALQKKKRSSMTSIPVLGMAKKTIQRNTKINFAVKPISFFFFFGLSYFLLPSFYRIHRT